MFPMAIPEDIHPIPSRQAKGIYFRYRPKETVIIWFITLWSGQGEAGGRVLP